MKDYQLFNASLIVTDSTVYERLSAISLNDIWRSMIVRVLFCGNNNISSLLVIDDDMECKDLIVMIIEDFGIQNRYVSL